MKISIYHFSGVLKGQTFGQLDEILETDLTGMNGTDLYCDPDSEDELLNMLCRQKKEGMLGKLRYFDSGNYHYMSKLLASLEEEPYTLINFDHHTDMQPSALLPILSCGSWILDLLKTDSPIERVLSVGPPEHMVQEARNLLVEESEQLHILSHQQKSAENSELPPVLFIKESELLDGKNEYGSIRDTIRYKLQRAGIRGRIYVSVDKDVLGKDVLDSTWDQGILKVEDLILALKVIQEAGEIIAIDVCGEPDVNASEEEIRKSEAINHILCDFAHTIWN